MFKHLLLAGLISLSSSMAVAQDSAPAKNLSDAKIAKILIQGSIDSYSGNCPCPYNQASNGSLCGKRSAYSKPGGAEPFCYRADVTDEMISDFRKSQ